MDLFDIAEKVKIARKERGFTQQELADKSGISRQRICLFETGNVDEMQFGNITKILSVLDLEINVDPIGKNGYAPEETGIVKFFRGLFQKKVVMPDLKIDIISIIEKHPAPEKARAGKFFRRLFQKKTV